MMAVFFFIAHEKGFKFHAQPRTGAYSCFLYILQWSLYKELQVYTWMSSIITEKYCIVFMN